MSHRNKGTSLPPLEDSGSLAGRSPRQGKKMTSYDYRPDSASPTTSPRSPDPSPRGGRMKAGDISPRHPTTKDVDKDFRTMCIGSPIPATDPHHDDMIVPETRHHQSKPKPFRKTPSITIDRVDELNLMKDNKKGSHGKGGGGSGAPLSPVSYDLIDRMPTTPFAKGNKDADRMLLISPTTPPVERKGNRQVINYCRSDGHLASTICSGDENEDDHHRQRHNRSKTDGQQPRSDNRSGDLSTMHPKGRELSPSPRLTRRERENDGGWSPREPSPSGHGGQKRANRSSDISPRGRSDRDDHRSSPRDAQQSPSPRQERRRRDTKEPTASSRPEARKPARLEPLGRK